MSLIVSVGFLVITTISAVVRMAFSKAKLPKGLSYPLKRSLLDAALRSADVYDMVL